MRLSIIGSGRRLIRGLTLLELLVVLVISSLLAVMVLQGLGFATLFSAKTRGRQIIVQDQLLYREWFRSTIEDLVVGRSLNQTLLGTRKDLQATTLSPLVGTSGIPMRIRWTLTDRRGSQDLLYSESGREYAVSENSSGGWQFQYFSRDGKSHDHWPVDSDKTDLPQKVALVNISMARPGNELADLYVQIRSKLKPDLLLEGFR